MYGTAGVRAVGAVGGSALAFTEIEVGWWTVAASTLLLAEAAIVRLVPRRTK